MKVKINCLNRYTIYADGSLIHLDEIKTSPIISSYYGISASQKGDITFINSENGAGVCLHPPLGRYLHFDSNFSIPQSISQIGIGTGTLPTMITTGAGRTHYKLISISVGHNVFDLTAFGITTDSGVFFIGVPESITGIISNIYFSNYAD